MTVCSSRDQVFHLFLSPLFRPHRAGDDVQQYPVSPVHSRHRLPRPPPARPPRAVGETGGLAVCELRQQTAGQVCQRCHSGKVGTANHLRTVLLLIFEAYIEILAPSQALLTVDCCNPLYFIIIFSPLVKN